MLSDPNFVAVPPSVSTQNFLCASRLVTFRWKCPTTAGAVVFEICAAGRSGSSTRSARTSALGRRLMIDLANGMPALFRFGRRVGRRPHADDLQHALRVFGAVVVNLFPEVRHEAAG